MKSLKFLVKKEVKFAVKLGTYSSSSSFSKHNLTLNDFFAPFDREAGERSEPAGGRPEGARIIFVSEANVVRERVPRKPKVVAVFCRRAIQRRRHFVATTQTKTSSLGFFLVPRQRGWSGVAADSERIKNKFVGRCFKILCSPQRACLVLSERSHVGEQE